MKIEAGKRYVRRDGRITGVIVKELDDTYPFFDRVHANSYTESGMLFDDDSMYDDTENERGMDLVGEYVSQESVEIKVLRAEVAELSNDVVQMAKAIVALQQTVLKIMDDPVLRKC